MLRPQNSQKYRVLWCGQGNLCRVTTDGNYPRDPRESLYLHTFVPCIRLGCMIYKTKIKDRLKRARARTNQRARARTNPTTHHIQILNFPGETRKTVGLVNPTPAKKKREKNATFSSFCSSVDNPTLPTSQRKRNLNDENKINTTAPEQKPNLNFNFN